MTIARRLTLALAAAALLSLPADAGAESAVGVLAGTNVLAGFDTSSPGTLRTVKQITGLSGPDERVLGLDFRHIPSDATQPPQLFALGVTRSGSNDELRLYTVERVSGAATQVGAAPLTIATPAGARYGFDFNPSSDRIRVVNSADLNMRINPFTGARADSPMSDPPITPGGAQLSAVAYDRVQLAGIHPTTAYAISGSDGQLGRIGGIDGSPSANGGAFAAIGPLGVTPDPGSSQDLDVAPGGTAYADLTSGGVQSLYAVDLTGATATPIGATAVPLTGLAVLPATTLAFDAAAVSAGESAGAATIGVMRSGSAGPDVSVAWSASNGAAGALSFAPGETSKAFSVPIAADTLDEPDERVTLTLSSPSFPATLGAPASATLTIADDDPAPDTAAPQLELKGVRRSITYKRLLARGVKVSVTPSEAVALEATLLGTTKRARLSRFELALAQRSLPLAPGTRSFKLKPKRSALRRPRRKVRLRLQVVATDAPGNRATARATVRLKPR